MYVFVLNCVDNKCAYQLANVLARSYIPYFH